MSALDTTNTAMVAQEIRRSVERWPEVRAVFGPSLGKPGQFFLRFVTESGAAYALELTADGNDDA